MSALRLSSTHTLTGSQLGNYRVVRLLGKGGFAHIYLGHHTYLGTSAAIKVPYTPLTCSGVKRFCEEARIAAHLLHPHIVRILEFGREGNIPFLAMDYASHGSLRQLHPRGEMLPLSTVVNYVKQVANALQYIHDRGLIHQDVKPENMLLGRDNQVLLSDFGIAVVARKIHAYKVKQSVGTVPYMAPEQIQGNSCLASDQYALGIVVYEWLCGSLPFQGTPYQIVQQHLVAVPASLSENVPGIPCAVEQVVLKSLAKLPEQRFTSVREFAQSLEETYKETLVVHRPSPHYVVSTSSRQKKVEVLPGGPRKIPNVWKEVAAFFATDMLVGTVICLIFSMLGVQAQTFWFFLLLCLAPLPLLRAFFLGRRRMLIYNSAILVVAAIPGIGFHSQALFAAIYISCLLLSTLVTFSLSIHTS